MERIQVTIEVTIYYTPIFLKIEKSQVFKSRAPALSFSFDYLEPACVCKNSCVACP